MNKKVWVGIDPSLRSSGYVAIDENDNIERMTLIQPSDKFFKDEELIDINGELAGAFFDTMLDEEIDIQGIAMERLAHGGASGSKDKICAGWWEIRRKVKDAFKRRNELFSWPPVIVAVNSWRAKVVFTEDRKKNKDNPDKNFLKECPYQKLPPQVRADIDKFCDGIKGSPHYDLSDAYWIARYVKELEDG